MKIIINAFQYSPDITGTDRMAYGFLDKLQKLDTTNKYIIVCSNESYNRSAISSANYKIITPFQLHCGRFVQRMYNKFWRAILPYRLRSYRADLYFSFHNMSLPKIKVARKSVVFNLDLIPVVLSGYESIHKKTREALLAEYKDIAEKTDHIISISEFSKNELSTLLSISPSKVSVIPLAVSDSLAQEATTSYDGLESRTFLLTIGGTEPRKNVKTVVEAFKKLPGEIQSAFPLVIIGGEWHGIKLDEFKNIPNVHCLGYVPEDQLPWLYANCKAFVFASEYEGFGFTVLEAMAAGVPVISSTSSSLAEVAGDAALLFEPHDSELLTKHLQRLVIDKNLERSLMESGQSRAKEFSWESSTHKLMQLIKDVTSS